MNGPDFGINRIRLQKELKNDSKSIFGGMFEMSPLDKFPDAIPIVLSNSFECLYISMGIYYLTGITQASIIGKSIYQFIDPDNKIAELFSNNINSNYCKSLKPLEFNEISNSYINDCICNNNLYIHDNEEIKINDPFKNLQRQVISIRFKSTKTYQGVDLLKQGSHCFIEMNLMCCIRNINFSLNEINLYKNISPNNRFLIGILVPFYMPKISKTPSQFYFFTYHKLCLQTQFISSYFLIQTFIFI